MLFFFFLSPTGVVLSHCTVIILYLNTILNCIAGERTATFKRLNTVCAHDCFRVTQRCFRQVHNTVFIHITITNRAGAVEQIDSFDDCTISDR